MTQTKSTHVLAGKHTGKSRDAALVQIVHDSVLHDEVNPKHVFQFFLVRIQFAAVLVENVPTVLVVSLEPHEQPAKFALFFVLCMLRTL